jgi:putative inorganic carbon (HCO3(-)) transporter
MSEAKITVRGKTFSLLIRFDRLHWLWLGLAAPFMLFPSPKRSLAMLVVPAVWLLHWFMVSWEQRTTSRQVSMKGRGRHYTFRFLLSALPPSALPLTPLNGSLLLMFCMVLISLWATFDIGYSLPKISGMVLGFGVFFAVAREGERPRGWILGLLAFIGIGLGIAALGVFGTSWFSSKIPLFNPIISRLPRLITGLQGAESGFHPNEVAGALIWVLPLMMTISVALFFLRRPPKNREAREQRKDQQEKMRGWRLVGVIILCLAATFFVAAVFLLSQSRGGYIGLALTLPVLIMIALPPRWRWYSLIALVVLTIVLGLVVAFRWEAVRIWVTGSNLAADPALSINTLAGRLEIWSRAIYGIQDFPFTGMGMNTFRKLMPVFYPLFLIGPDIDIGHAHNEFLQVALDLGIPGLIAFLALYIGAFWMLADVWRATRHPPLNTGNWSLVTRSLAIGLGGGLLAHLLYGLTDAVALGAKPGVLFWMLLGLIAGLYRQAQEHWAVVDSSVPTTRAENGLSE